VNTTEEPVESPLNASENIKNPAEHPGSQNAFSSFGCMNVKKVASKTLPGMMKQHLLGVDDDMLIRRSLSIW
jgi:hypothetical protein